MQPNKSAPLATFLTSVTLVTMSLSRHTGQALFRTALSQYHGGMVSARSFAASRAAQSSLSSNAFLGRTFATSSRLPFAQPTTGPTQIKEAPAPEPHSTNKATADAQFAQREHAQYPEEMTQYPDYSKGPSALDKASQLFFFTEILRGG